MQEEDFITSNGLPFLSHRLRRASERINEGTAQLLRSRGSSAPARSASTLLLLGEKGPLGIMEIAHRLRLSHPLIIRLTTALAEAGYVRLNADPEDGRRKVVSITRSGRREVEKILEINRIIEAALQRLFEESGVDLLAALEGFERAIRARSLENRFQAETKA